MSMRLTASVRQKRLRKNFRQLVEEGLGRAREGNAPTRVGDLPRTSNLALTSEGRALLADPFTAVFARDAASSADAER